MSDGGFVRSACLGLLLCTTLASPSLGQTHNLRDPFVPVRPRTPAQGRLALNLTGVLESDGACTAIVCYAGESRILHVGDFFEGTRVLRITPGGLTLVTAGQQKRVSMGESEITLSFQYAWSYSLEPDAGYATARWK